MTARGGTVRLSPFQLEVNQVKGESPNNVHWGLTMAYRPTGELAAKAYCFGGLKDIHQYSSETYVLNAETGGSVHGTYFATSGLIERYMVVFGGMSSIGWKSGSPLKVEKPTGHFQVLDLDSKQWIEPRLRTSLRPPARAMASSCVIGNRWYIFGGWGEKGLLRDLWCLDCSRRGEWEWKKMRTTELKPDARCKATLTALPDKEALFLFGGGSVKDDVAFNDSFRYNLKKEKWEKVAQQGTPPSPRTGHSATLYSSRRENNQWNCFDSLFVFELNSGQWIEPPQSADVRTRARKLHISFTNDAGGKSSKSGEDPEMNRGLAPSKVYTVSLETAFKRLLQQKAQ